MRRYVKALFWQPCWTTCLKNCDCSGCCTHLLLQSRALWVSPASCTVTWFLTEVVNETVKRGGLYGLRVGKCDINIAICLLLQPFIVNRQAHTPFTAVTLCKCLCPICWKWCNLNKQYIFTYIYMYIRHWLFPVSYHVYCTVKSFNIIA